jgi:hypothetical protein
MFSIECLTITPQQCKQLQQVTARGLFSAVILSKFQVEELPDLLR